MNPCSPVLVELESFNAGFRPGKHAKGSECGSGIEKYIFPVQLDRYHVRIKAAAIHGFGKEEVALAIRNPEARGVKSGGTGERQEKPGEFRTIAVLLLPDCLDVVGILLLAAFLFLFGLCDLIGS